MAISTINPATGLLEKEYRPMTAEEVAAALTAARGAALSLAETTFADRARWMRRAADLLEEDVERLAALMTREMGKTLVSARAEVRKAATGCRFYAEHAEAMLAPEQIDPADVGALRAGWVYQPLGVVLAV